MERLTHYNYTDANGFILSVDDQEKANIELARYENFGIEAGELAWILDDYKAMKDAEEQGRLIVFPVSIGQHLWAVDDYGCISELTVRELVQTLDDQQILADSLGIVTYYSLSRIGETIFPTREQAHAKLKEMEADNAEDH